MDWVIRLASDGGRARCLQIKNAAKATAINPQVESASQRICLSERTVAGAAEATFTGAPLTGEAAAGEAALSWWPSATLDRAGSRGGGAVAGDVGVWVIGSAAGTFSAEAAGIGC